MSLNKLKNPLQNHSVFSFSQFLHPGEHMKGNQFMDGTPHVTQCPILPSAKFVMKFKAQEKTYTSGCQKNCKMYLEILRQIFLPTHFQSLSRMVPYIKIWQPEQRENCPTLHRSQAHTFGTPTSLSSEVMEPLAAMLSGRKALSLAIIWHLSKNYHHLLFKKYIFRGTKVATYHHVHRAEPKEPSQFGSVSGSEIHFQPTFSNGICI